MIVKDFTKSVQPLQCAEPGNLRIQFVVFSSLTDPKGTANEVEWGQFCKLMGKLKVLTDKREAKLWSPCVLKDNIRNNNNVVLVTALTFDIDHGADKYSFEALKQTVGQHAGFIHTTYSHSIEQPRYRVTYPLKYPIPAKDYATKRNAFLAMHPELAKLVDPACKDLSRAYFRYSCHQGNQDIARFEILLGDPIDPDNSILNAPSACLPEYSNRSELDLSVNNAIIGQAETAENVRKVEEALSLVSADCHYSDWRDVIFSLKSTGWVCAEALARQWSQKAADRWDEEAFNLLWSNSKEYGGISLGTLFYKAKLAMFDDFSHDNTLINSSIGQDPTVTKPLRSFNPEDGVIKINNTPPAARDYVFANSVVPGTLAIFSGLGGTAKTTALMQIAVHGALGRNLGDLSVSSFSSLLFLGEETEEERDRRIGAICKDLSESDKIKITSRIRCYPAAGKDLRLTATIQNNLLETHLATEVISMTQAFNDVADIPAKLIVFDHARLVMSGDANDAGDVTQLTRVLTDIAIKTQTAVVLLGHSPKAVINKDTASDASEIFGSTAFVDNARSAFVLHTMREAEGKTYGIEPAERKNYVCLTTVKANYGDSNVCWWFKKVFIDGWQTIKLEPARLYDQNIFTNHSKLSQKLLDLIRRYPAQLTERKIRDRAGLTGELGASESRVRNSLNRLIEEGAIEKRSASKEEKERYKLSPNIREVMVLPEDTVM